MATINGTNGPDTLAGTNEDDDITALAGNDRVSGEGGNDRITGGAGDDVLFGDAGQGTALGQDATPLFLSANNFESQTFTGNNAAVGDSAVYRDVALLEDGTQVWGRIILVNRSDPFLTVNLSGNRGAEILMNGNGTGDTADFRFEFFDPTTNEPVALNSIATFNDIDRNASPSDRESVILQASSFSSFGVSSDTSLAVETTPTTIIASGTERNTPLDQDAWFSAQFDNRTFIEFSLEARSTNSGFTFSGDLIDDVVTTTIVEGNDTVLGGAGNDQIFGQGGNDSLDGGADNDTISGGEGNDQIAGGAGDDVISAGGGTDNVDGGAGNDTIIGGGDNDNLRGGDDRDLFQIGSLDDTPVNNTSVDGGSGGDDFDTLDLTQLISDGWVVTNRVQNPENNGNPGFNGQIQLQRGGDFANINFTDIEQIICFTPGTRIATPKGEVLVEKLRSGDRVFTRDNGVQVVAWTGRRALSTYEMQQRPEWQPVFISKGAMGRGLPERDLLVSPNHRMLLTSDMSDVLYGEREVLVAAKHLTHLDGIDMVQSTGLTYVHVLFEQHEILLGNGAWTESFQPGDVSLNGVGEAQRDEIMTLFPELATDTGMKSYTSARRTLKRHESRLTFKL